MKNPRSIWSDGEKARVFKIVSKSATAQEAVEAVQGAFPKKAITRAVLDGLMTHSGKSLAHELAKNRAAKSADDKSGELATFAASAKKGGTLEDLCDRLDLAPKRAKAMVAAAKAAGYRIELKGGQVGYVPPEPMRGETRVVAPPGAEQAFGVISDLHIGSKYCLEEQLRDFVIRAHKDHGVTQFFGPGDNLDGVYRHSRWEESYHGFEAQAGRMAFVLPGKKDGLKGVRYDMIAGNHDETHEKDNGMDVCRAIEDVFRRNGRDDLRMHGHRGAYLRYAPKGGRGVLVELWHPLGGGAYAVSYKIQRHVEEYGVGRKPDFLLVGHFHQQAYVVRRGVHGFLSGTFHGDGSGFGKALGGSQAIGAWIVKFRQTPQGTVREVSPTWTSYYEAEEVRSLGLT